MIQWVAFDLRTGDSLASLPGLIVDYPIARTIGQYETASSHLIIDGSQPVNWIEATLPGKALFACYDDEDASTAIQWAGYVNTRVRNAETDTVDLTMVTTEGYLDRRDVSADVTFTNVGQNAIVKSLIENYIQDGTGVPGLPISVVYTDPGNDGTLISQTYNDADNGTVYEAVTALAALDGGPEWAIEWQWRADHSGLAAVFYVGARIGTPAPVTGSPAATFEMPGSLISAILTEDYSSDKGANAVEAYSTTSGIAPSGYQTTTDTAGRPRIEYRFEPQAGITTTAQLISFAAKAVRNMVNGASSVELVADRITAPAFGSTWVLGDDIGYIIGGLADDGGDLVPSFPGGLRGVERAIGVQLSLDTISPVATVAP